jgi:hypothetical protein
MYDRGDGYGSRLQMQGAWLIGTGALQERKHVPSDAVTVRQTSAKRLHNNYGDDYRSKPLFRPMGKDSTAHLEGQSHVIAFNNPVPHDGSMTKARTVSAQRLISIDHGDVDADKSFAYKGYAVLRIIPGLHPVLRAPCDWQEIPVSQHSAMSTFSSSDTSANQPKIERVFSHNGETWDYLSNFARGSTLTGKGFYLRKSDQGSWVLLMGCVHPSNLPPPYVLWSLVDSVKLCALDIDAQVLNVLLMLVYCAYCKLEGKDCQTIPNPLDSEITYINTLNSLRCMSLKAMRYLALDLGTEGKDEAALVEVASKIEHIQKYARYLEIEHRICAHYLKKLRIIELLQSPKHFEEPYDLDEYLKPEAAFEEMGPEPHTLISQLVQMWDFRPRSNLVFSLRLVCANQARLLIKMAEVLPEGSLEAPVSNVCNPWRTRRCDYFAVTCLYDPK